MKHIYSILFLMAVGSVCAQEKTPTFREDQVYLSIAYPYFSDAPSTLIQNKLSYAFSIGFIRDMPINSQRTLAVGVGLGFDQATLYNNTLFAQSGNSSNATLIENEYQQNYLRMQSLAIPLELRWRNATETKHAFWRIHTGVSVHFPMQLKSYVKTRTGQVNTTKLPSTGSVLRWNVHFGFNTWNISIAHDMQPWATFNASNKEFNMKFTKIGLIFYIL
jgi:hypothetical protein